MKGVVPGAARGVAFDRQGVHALRAECDARRVVAGVQFGLHAQPGAGAGGSDRLDDDVMAGQRPPRQFIVIWENSRCSILFHLLVPGGKWQTVTASPVSAAKSASSAFHNR